MLASQQLHRRFIQLFLILADVIGLTLIFFLAQYIRFGSSRAIDFIKTGITSDLQFVSILGIVLVSNYIFDLYEPRHWRSRLFSPLKILLATMTAAVLTFSWLYLLSSQTTGIVGRGIFLGGMGCYFLYSLLLRLIVDRRESKLESRRNWLLVGTAASLELLKDDFARMKMNGQLDWINREDNSVLTAKLKTALNQDWSAIIVDGAIPTEATRIIMNARVSGQVVLSLQNFYEFYCGKIPVHSLDDSWFAFTEGFSIIHSHMSARMKRVFDILISALLMVLTAPILLLVWILIRLESKGAALYSQKRVGVTGQIFTMWKLRSMRIDAEASGPQWAAKNDDRITRVGRFIRKVRLDELPQLWNILKGDMSFIGPRPERPEFVNQLREKIPFYDFRHLVKPGLSGWAQVMYPYGASDKDAKEKLQYDLFYIKNYSFELDVEIIFKTVSVVLFGAGR